MTTTLSYSYGAAITNAAIAEVILSGNNAGYGEHPRRPGHVHLPGFQGRRPVGTVHPQGIGDGELRAARQHNRALEQVDAQAILEVGTKLDSGNSSIYDLNRAIGTGAGQIALQGANKFSNVGFAAFGGTTLSNGVVVRSVGLSVSGVVTGTILSKAAGLPVPNGGGDGYVFGSPTANSTLVMVNGIDTEGTAANRNFRFMPLRWSEPEVMFTGQLRNGTNSGNTLNFGGTGGFILNNVSPTGPFTAPYANSNLETGSAAGSDVGTSTGIVLDRLAPGACSSRATTPRRTARRAPSPTAPPLTIGNNAIGNSGTNLGAINTGLMTYGNSQIGTTPTFTPGSPGITIARNLIMGTGGTGDMSVGGFTPDYTKFSGTLNLNGVNTFLTSRTGGQVDFTGVISGAGNVTVGNTVIEGVGITFGTAPASAWTAAAWFMSPAPTPAPATGPSPTAPSASPTPRLGHRHRQRHRQLRRHPGRLGHRQRRRHPQRRHILSPHAAASGLAATASTLTLNGGLTLSGNALNFNFGTTTNTVAVAAA